MSRSLILLCLLYSASIQGSKRLLLNDGEVLEARFRQMEIEIQSLKAQVSTMDSKIENIATGGVFTRWGRSTCPGGNLTELVYTGVAGGGYYDHPGSSADYVCLPHDPDFISMTPSNPWLGYMYGAEYEDNLFGSGYFQNNVPCAVCRATRATSILMIPGKSSCYKNWQTEYTGKLASGAHQENAASQYVCVDGNAEILERGSADENGKLFFAVVAKCGSLPCPPYKEDAVLSCVVCSK